MLLLLTLNLGTSTENVDKAIEELKTIISKLAFKSVGLIFQDEALLHFALPKIRDALHEVDSYDLVYDVNAEVVKVHDLQTG